MTRLAVKMLAALSLSAVLLQPFAAYGAVRVVDDEVIFTLAAPGANEVFLVGDFNNWNPYSHPHRKTSHLPCVS